VQQLRIKKEIDARISSVLAHGNYIMGPEVKELEAKLAEYVGVKHAIGCTSGTDALLLALMAYGVGPGDAVLTTPFTFIATAEVISLLGATPVFVDIDPVTFNIDPLKLNLAIKAVKENDPGIYPLPRTSQSKSQSPTSQIPHLTSNLLPRGVIPVDLFGLPADYDAIRPVADDHGLFLIEDAAQSFGAVYKGRNACSVGDIGCTSFFPAKPLGCYGDGGMCFTDDPELAEMMDSLRVHGKGSDKYDNIRIGINGRLDTIQAAILLAKFELFPEEVQLRQKVAENYSKAFSARNCQVSLPRVPDGMQSVWAQYSILARDGGHRVRIQEKLKERGIPSAIYYPRPLHLQTAFAFLGYGKGDFPVSEDCAARIFSLPMHPYLKPEEQERIAEIVQEVTPV
jgi:UDP-2-acetamido-2-deoxy-ribo-hexuluronate aminotransferase